MVSMSTQAQRRSARREAQGERVARTDQFEWLARAGLVARGVVYGIIGILALKLALGDGGKATDQQGALQTIARQPFGKVLLVARRDRAARATPLWRLVRAAIGHGPEASDDTKERIAGVVSGIGYAALCVTAVRSSSAPASGGGSSNPDKTTGGVLDWPAGRVLVAIAGLIIIGVGLEQGYKGVKKQVPRELQDRGDGDRGCARRSPASACSATWRAWSSSARSAGSSSRRRSTTTPTRRSGWTARWPSSARLVRADPARDRRRRA